MKRYSRLPQIINIDHCRYDLILKLNKSAIYSMKYSDAVDPNRIIGYDVIRLIYPDTKKPAVMIPDSEDWGIHAWSFDKIETATKKAQELN